jgi:hypothetical protein
MQLNKNFANKASTLIVLITFASLVIYFQYYFASGDDLSSTVYALGNTSDKFGVLEIYPTASGGQTWFFNPMAPADGQFDENGAGITKNSDGSWHVEPGTTRMLAFTKNSGILSDDVRGNLTTYDYSELAKTGYWYAPQDWKNVEITGYFKVTNIMKSGGEEISVVSRGIRHDDDVYDGCGGASYHNNIDVEKGQFRFKKEMYHVNYDTSPHTGINISSVMNKWFGFKGIVYNLPDGNIKLETFVDKDNNNHWEKAAEMIDKGDWGDDMIHCNAPTPGEKITWGSPEIIYKTNEKAFDFQKLSVREIIPPK